MTKRKIKDPEDVYYPVPVDFALDKLNKPKTQEITIKMESK